MAENQVVPLKPEAEEKQKPMKALSSPSNNPIVNLIQGDKGKTLWQTAVDPESMVSPWNPDDLYQKAGDYSIYEDMMKDDQVSVAMNIKKDLIIGSGWHIACEEGEQEDMKKDLEVALTEDPDDSFEDYLGSMITAYENGFSVSEKQFKIRDDGKLTLKAIKTRNPVSWLFHQDQYGNVTRYEQQGTSREFADIEKNSLIHFVNNPRYGNPYGTSDLRAAYAAYFIKKQIIRYYAIFLEKAASPTPVAKYDRTLGLDSEIQKIHDTIKKLQTSTALTIPKDFEIEFLQATGNGEAYIKGLNMFNMFIGRALFVPDLLGFQGGETSGGSQALGREQMVVFFKHIMRRRRTLESLVNEHIVKPIVMWNRGEVENYPKFKLSPIEEDRAIENAKLWLEAVKGRAVKVTLADTNKFKEAIAFTELTEEEWDEQQGDALDDAAAMAPGASEVEEILQNAEGGNDKAIPGEGSEADPKEAGKEPVPPKGEDNKRKESFAKAYDLPKGSFHKKTDFRAIEKQLDSNLDTLTARATPIIKEIFEKFAEKLAAKNWDKAKKLESLDKIALSKPDLRRLEKLLDESFIESYERSGELAAKEIFKDNFAAQPKKEFLKTLEEEDYNFIRDWEYQITKRVRTNIVAALKDGMPISEVINKAKGEDSAEALISVNRYARTKFTEVMNKGRLEYFQNTKVVGAYQFSAILDDRTSDLCAGLHGKIFKAGSEPVPPLHFNCRSLLIPITNYEDWEADEKVGKQNINDFIEENIGKGFSKY